MAVIVAASGGGGGGGGGGGVSAEARRQYFRSETHHRPSPPQPQPSTQAPHPLHNYIHAFVFEFFFFLSTIMAGSSWHRERLVSGKECVGTQCSCPRYRRKNEENRCYRGCVWMLYSSFSICGGTQTKKMVTHSLPSWAPHDRLHPPIGAASPRSAPHAERLGAGYSKCIAEVLGLTSSIYLI